MKILKKVVCLAFCLAVTLSFVSCFDKTEKVPTLIWYDRSAQTKDHELVTEAINEYIEPKIGAKVKRISIVGSEFNEKMRLILAANEPADVIYTGGSTYHTYVENGSFMPLNDLLDEHGKELKKITPDYALNAAKIDGELYMVPIYKDYAVEHVVRYNKELADKYNLGEQIAQCKTLADFEPILETIHKNEPDIYPFKFLSTLSGHDLLQYDTIMGNSIGAIDLEGDPNKIVNQFTTDKALEYYKLMHKWYKKDFMRKDIATVTSNSDISGREFMSIEQELPYLIDQHNAAHLMPYELAVSHLIQPKMGTKNVIGMGFAIGANCKYPEKAMAFINLLNTDPTLRNMASLGIEGKHWIAVGDDFFKLPEGCKTKADTGFETYGSPQGNKYIFRMIEGTPADIYEKYQEFDESAIKSPAMGFVFNPKNVQNEITAVNNKYQEYFPALITGAVDPDVVFPKAVKELKEAGADKIIAEIQKQYDEWRKNK